MEVEIDYDNIYDDYMAELKTVDNYVELYGGPVTSTKPKMDAFGKLTFSFSRPISYPAELLEGYDSTYKEKVPELKPSKE